MTSGRGDRTRQAALIKRATEGDLDAFSRLVREYQDMALGYAVSLLGDFHVAEDAAQETFVTLSEKLQELRDPVAFPAWFRTIVRTACTRLTRGKRLQTISPNDAHNWVMEVPVEARENIESDDEVMATVRSLPEAERAVITLHYISSYSRREISRFLGGGPYYTRTRRVNGRQIREYIGGGILGQEAARIDAEARQQREEERRAWKQMKADLAQIEREMRAHEAMCKTAVAWVLEGSGFFNHRGEWRKRSG